MAASKLKEARVSSTTITDEVKKNKEPPAGAKILSKTVRIETEKIENGWLISKNFDISYEVKGNRDYTYYTKKWYSENDPLTIKVNDTALADEFEGE